LKEKGLTVTIDDLSQEIRERDRRDSSRPVAPLRPAADAILLDSTGLAIEQVVDQVLELARSRLPAMN
jgi:cytidylate kinase